MYVYPTCSSSNLTIDSSVMQITVGSAGTPQARCDAISCLRLSGILIVQVEEAETEKEELLDNVKVADEATAMTHKEVVTADG